MHDSVSELHDLVRPSPGSCALETPPPTRSYARTVHQHVPLACSSRQAHSAATAGLTPSTWTTLCARSIHPLNAFPAQTAPSEFLASFCHPIHTHELTHLVFDSLSQVRVSGCEGNKRQDDGTCLGCSITCRVGEYIVGQCKLNADGSAPALSVQDSLCVSCPVCEAGDFPACCFFLLPAI